MFWDSEEGWPDQILMVFGLLSDLAHGSSSFLLTYLLSVAISSPDLHFLMCSLRIPLPCISSPLPIYRRPLPQCCKVKHHAVHVSCNLMLSTQRLHREWEITAVASWQKRWLVILSLMGSDFDIQSFDRIDCTIVPSVVFSHSKVRSCEWRTWSIKCTHLSLACSPVVQRVPIYTELGLGVFIQSFKLQQLPRTDCVSGPMTFRRMISGDKMCSLKS